MKRRLIGWISPNNKLSWRPAPLTEGDLIALFLCSKPLTKRYINVRITIEEVPIKTNNAPSSKGR